MGYNWCCKEGRCSVLDITMFSALGHAHTQARSGHTNQKVHDCHSV